MTLLHIFIRNYTAFLTHNFTINHFFRITSYSWPKAIAFILSIRQVSRLIVHRLRHLPGFPVIHSASLPNYGDEFVQDSHLFPYSPKQAGILNAFYLFSVQISSKMSEKNISNIPALRHLISYIQFFVIITPLF